MSNPELGRKVWQEVRQGRWDLAFRDDAKQPVLDASEAEFLQTTEALRANTTGLPVTVDIGGPLGSGGPFGVRALVFAFDRERRTAGLAIGRWHAGVLGTPRLSPRLAVTLLRHTLGVKSYLVWCAQNSTAEVLFAFCVRFPEFSHLLL